MSAPPRAGRTTDDHDGQVAVCERQSSLSKAMRQDGSAAVLLSIGPREPLDFNADGTAAWRPYHDVDSILTAQSWDIRSEALVFELLPEVTVPRPGLAVATRMRGQQNIGCFPGPPSISPTPEDPPDVSLEVILVPVFPGEGLGPHESPHELISGDDEAAVHWALLTINHAPRKFFFPRVRRVGRRRRALLGRGGARRGR